MQSPSPLCILADCENCRPQFARRASEILPEVNAPKHIDLVSEQIAGRSVSLHSSGGQVMECLTTMECRGTCPLFAVEKTWTGKICDGPEGG